MDFVSPYSKYLNCRWRVPLVEWSECIPSFLPFHWCVVGQCLGWWVVASNCEDGLQDVFVLMPPACFLSGIARDVTIVCIEVRFFRVYLDDVCARVVWMQQEMCEHVGNHLDVLCLLWLVHAD